VTFAPNVRFGSKAEETPMNCDVCFTPESGQPTNELACRLSARSGHRARHPR
jgi:hypothetical protein